MEKTAIMAVIFGWHEVDIRVSGTSMCRVVIERGTCSLKDGAAEGKGFAK